MLGGGNPVVDAIGDGDDDERHDETMKARLALRLIGPA